VKPWKRWVLLTGSVPILLLGVAGMFQTQSIVSAVLGLLISVMGAGGIVVSLFGCDDCVARFFGDLFGL